MNMYVHVKSKEENMAEMRRKMMELQEQVRHLERQQVTGAGSAMAPLGAAGAPGLPAVDPRSVHVQGVSPLAVPDVIAAHFSGCAIAGFPVLRSSSRRTSGMGLSGLVVHMYWSPCWP